MGPVGDVDGRLLDGGMREEVGAEQAAIERPVVLGVGGGMDPGPAASAADVALERILLSGPQDVAGGVEEDDGVERTQALRGEDPCILRRADREAVRPAEASDRRDD